MQGAASQANATQKNPVNIAVQIIVNSPGASPVIVQNNSNSSSAHSSNGSSTTQNSHAAQSGGGGGGGGSAQGVQQAGTTVQGAGSQAQAAQANPVNIAVQVVKDSPGASPVIVQTNGNAAGAKAENAAATSQGAVASQAGSGSRAGTPSPAAAHPAAASLSPPNPPPASGGSGVDLEALLGGFPDLAWVWESLAADLRPLPTVPGWVLGPVGWPLPRFDGRAAAPGEARGAAGHATRSATRAAGSTPARAERGVRWPTGSRSPPESPPRFRPVSSKPLQISQKIRTGHSRSSRCRDCRLRPAEGALRSRPGSSSPWWRPWPSSSPHSGFSSGDSVSPRRAGGIRPTWRHSSGPADPLGLAVPRRSKSTPA